MTYVKPTRPLYDELEVKKLQLENVVQRQTRGAMIRSKARWHNEGEKKHEILLKLGKKAFYYQNHKATSA